MVTAPRRHGVHVYLDASRVGTLLLMCGIAAVLRQGAKVDQAEITAMTRALAHRGPDGEGVWLHENLALGHRRLSIIDPELGAQPMTSADGRCTITYNGELYNFKELREDLRLRGHEFRTQSDTEVILAAYQEWGTKCVEEFRGMFAFCIADLRRRRLFLARDHFGIKPLFYMATPSIFACGSELSALKILPEFPRDISLQALDSYLWFQYVPDPQTIYEGVWKLPPGHRMTVTFGGKVSEPERYYDVKFQPDESRSEADWLEELDSVLIDSVKAHLVSDVPFGAFLSGGADSSAVVSYMSKMLVQPVKTFSIGFEEEGFSELPYAETAAGICHTEHHSAVLRADALRILPELVSHYGEPFGDSSAIPTYFVSKLAREHVPMVLSGDGGDEAFAGYNSHIAWMQQGDQLRPQSLWRRLRGGESELPHWIGVIQYISTSERTRLWKPEFQGAMQTRAMFLESAAQRVRGVSRAQKVQYTDLMTYLPYAILTKVDRASMMHGLEVRTPLLDTKVWELARRIPSRFLMAKNESGGWEGKLLLKKLLEKHFPREMIYRRKMGFAVPLAKWFAKDGAYRKTLEQKLLDPQSRIAKYFDQTVVAEIIDKNLSNQAWLLLFLEEWLRQKI